LTTLSIQKESILNELKRLESEKSAFENALNEKEIFY
jgi:hypothetical protein